MFQLIVLKLQSGAADSSRAIILLTALPGPDTNECPQGCSANAVCIEGCCVCKLGYYGNGISCLGGTILLNYVPVICSVDIVCNYHWLTTMTVFCY